MIVGPKKYYINNRVPLFGTASGTFKFSSDGTLTDATTSITDETGKTILGLFPVSALLTKSWNLMGAKEGKAPVPSHIEIEVKIIPRKTLYTLKKVSEISDEQAKDLNKLLSATASRNPLSLWDAKNGNNGVQLISVEILSDSPKTKPDKKSYQLQGSITPPEKETPADASDN